MMQIERHTLIANLAIALVVVATGLLAALLLSSTLDSGAVSQMGLLAALLCFAMAAIAGLSMFRGEIMRRENELLIVSHTQMPDFQYVKNLKSEFVAVNRKVAQHNGFASPQDMMGKTDFDIAPPARAQELFEAEQSVLQSGRSLLNVEELVTDKDGRERWFVTSKAPVRNRRGKIIGLTGVTHEITERKQLEGELLNSRNLFSYALAEMSDGLAMFDSDGFLVFCNEQYRNAFPLTADVRKPGTNYREILQAMADRGELIVTPAEEIDTWIENVCAALKVENEREVQLCDGRWLQWRSRPTSNGASLVVLSDVTKSKRMEIMKDEFISTVSHELRTPLTSIQGALGLLLAKTADTADEKTQKLLKLSHDSTTRLTRLVNDILDVEKIAAGKMAYNFEDVDICALVSDIVEAQVLYADKYGVRLVLHVETGEVMVKLDRDRFHQALVNLLSNAIKFSSAGKVVEVSVSLNSYGQVRVDVRDYGMGIPASFRDKIFNKFAQADGSATRAKGGSGLGLSITKSIIEALGGTIDYESEEGKGSVFTFILPLSAEKQMRA